MFVPPWKDFLREHSPPILFLRGGDTMLYLHTFPISKSSSLTSEVKLPSHCVFKVMQYGYENFQNCFKIDLQNHIAKNIKHNKFNGSKAPKLFSAINSEINTIANIKTKLLSKIRGS